MHEVKLVWYCVVQDLHENLYLLEMQHFLLTNSICLVSFPSQITTIVCLRSRLGKALKFSCQLIATLNKVAIRTFSKEERVENSIVSLIDGKSFCMFERA